MKLKDSIKLIFISSLVVMFFRCSSNQQNDKAKTKLDSVNVEEEKPKVNSLSIAILTPEGKIIDTINYEHVELSIDSTKPPEYLNYIKGYPLSDTIIGDFNGDGNKEKAWFKDIGIEAFEDCRQNGTKKSCEGTILFSDKTIKPLKIDFCPISIFKNEGDLYDNGKDAIGVLPGWFSSSCRQYSVFTLKKQTWELACSPIRNTLNMREAGIVLIEKDLTKSGWAIVRESVDSYVSRVEKHKIPQEYISGSSCQQSNIVEQTIKLN